MTPPVVVNDLEYPRHQDAFSSNKHLNRFRLPKGNCDSAIRVPRHGEANVYDKTRAKGHGRGGAMKKLSPKFVTFRNAPVTYVNAETNVEETRLVPQIIFSFDKEIDLGDNTERKTMFFFLSQWRKAFHDADAGAYLQEMDKRFGDDVPKHQDAFNRLSQACTWSIDLNDDGFPAIVGVELPDPIKAAAAKFKAARDAEMSPFGI